MFEIQCLDSYGNTINHFTQWDIDQKVIIPIDSCNLPESELPSSPAYATPEVHFCNTKMDERYIVRSEVVDGKTISAEVPNILLQEPYPILVYVYMVDSQDASSQKAILRNEIPVRKAVKPSDYFYIENIRRITAEMIKEEIKSAVEDTKTQAINAVNEAKIAAIGDETTGTIGSIGKAESDFEIRSEEIIGELEQIRDDAQETYEETVATAASVEEDIRSEVDKMLDQGLLVQTAYNDGDVVVSIAFAQSS